MGEQAETPLELRSRALFAESVDNLDMRVRSRLTQARHAAIEAASSRRAAWFVRVPLWASAAGVSAAAVLGVALWIGAPSGDRDLTAAGLTAVSDVRSGLEDLDLVASTDESSGDALEMMQDDADFYDWAADKAANPDSGSVG